MPRTTKGTDKYIYILLDKITPLCCKYNIHPNIITLSNIINSIFLFINIKCYNNKKIIIIQMILYYIFDCLDGEVARKCNKQSKLGGYLDTISDMLFFAIILNYFIYKFILKDSKYFNFKYIILFYLILFSIFDKYYNLETHTQTNNKLILEYMYNNCIIMLIIASYLVYI